MASRSPPLSRRGARLPARAAVALGAPLARTATMQRVHTTSAGTHDGEPSIDHQPIVTPPSYADLHAMLTPKLRAYIEDLARRGGELDGSVWYALGEATGQSRDWLEGYLGWVGQHLPPLLPADGVGGTSSPVDLHAHANDPDPTFDGAVTVDEHGWNEYHGTYQGSRFPGAKYRDDLDVKLNHEIKDEYLAAIERELPGIPRGMKLFMTCMTTMEGFASSSTSYTTNNPGNIGNTDKGKRNPQIDLDHGVRLQYEYLLGVARGTDPHYPLGEKVELAPYYSDEIAKHPDTYQKSPYVPGYEFVYTGQLDQFIKIYSTGARAGNNYLNTIVSYFANNGIDIDPESKLQDIIALQ